jgi:hypothetical protein
VLTLFWINLLPGMSGPTADERKRILQSLTLLYSPRLLPAILIAPLFVVLKALLRVMHFGWKRFLKKLLPI